MHKYIVEFSSRKIAKVNQKEPKMLQSDFRFNKLRARMGSHIRVLPIGKMNAVMDCTAKSLVYKKLRTRMPALFQNMIRNEE